MDILTSINETRRRRYQCCNGGFVVDGSERLAGWVLVLMNHTVQGSRCFDCLIRSSAWLNPPGKPLPSPKRPFLPRLRPARHHLLLTINTKSLLKSLQALQSRIHDE